MDVCQPFFYIGKKKIRNHIFSNYKLHVMVLKVETRYAANEYDLFLKNRLALKSRSIIKSGNTYD
jgi:hypothetical protein